MYNCAKCVLVFIVATLLLFLVLDLTGWGTSIGPIELLLVIPFIAVGAWWLVYRMLPRRRSIR